MLNRKAKTIDPYENICDAMAFVAMLEAVTYFDVNKTREGKEIVYKLSIDFRDADSVCIDIPVLVAHQKEAHELMRLILHTLGWRKEAI